MPTVFFTTALRRFLPASTAEVEGGTVGEALDIVFGAQPELRSYVLDDQGSGAPSRRDLCKRPAADRSRNR